MYNWVTMLYSIKLMEHCKQAKMEKNKNHYIKKKENINKIGNLLARLIKKKMERAQVNKIGN